MSEKKQPKQAKQAVERTSAASFFENNQKNLEENNLEQIPTLAEETRDELMNTVRLILKQGAAKEDFTDDIIKELRLRMASRDVEAMPTFALVKLLEILGDHKNEFAGHVLKAVQASAQAASATPKGASGLLDGRRVFVRDGAGKETAYNKEQVQTASQLLQVMESLTGAEVPDEIKSELENMDRQLKEGGPG